MLRETEKIREDVVKTGPTSGSSSQSEQLPSFQNQQAYHLQEPPTLAPLAFIGMSLSTLKTVLSQMLAGKLFGTNDMPVCCCAAEKAATGSQFEEQVVASCSIRGLI